jgi:hypothetical protein
MKKFDATVTFTAQSRTPIYCITVAAPDRESAMKELNSWIKFDCPSVTVKKINLKELT